MNVLTYLIHVMKYLLFLLILISIATKLFGLSILLVETIFSTSHHIWISGLVKELLRKGHHVHFTSIHTLKMDDSLAQNYTNKGFDDVMHELIIDHEYVPTTWRTYNFLYMIYFTHKLSNFMCEKIISHPTTKDTIELVKVKKFDIIVQDVTLPTCFYGLWEFAEGNPPVIGYVPFGNVPWLKDYIGGSSYPAIRPYVHIYMGIPVTIWDRTLNFICYVLDDLFRHYYMMPINQKLTNILAGKELRPLTEYERNISIVFINTHYSFEPAIPLPPNAIEIAGIHAQTAQPIRDKMICKFLDDAEDGAIIISMGTNVAWNRMESDKVKIVAAVLSKFKQRIIWKLAEDVDVQLSKNILALKWIPQNDILTHKNVKAIWTHAGLLSTHEAIWHGVPMIGMPFFMDQNSNIKMLVDKRVAIYLNYEEISMDTVEQALREIIYNPIYSQNMKKLSREFRDRPIPPLDLAVWYVEYVSRHPGKDFGSPGRFLTHMEQNLYDVYILLFMIFLISILISVICVYFLYVFAVSFVIYTA
ncbi:hypothetical protein HZH68_007709 [Vespula germanica]|uniref:Uncharacterized protein n=1 Tax=Vespula germanica TaxID=30212 RepID=A0A834K485_VESGE|nr:hypothetical protein HZH68_007709 [Vespula germanica]